MRELQKIVDAWYSIDADLQGAQNSAQTKGHSRRAQQLLDLRTKNDRAYFLLIFAHFEAYLTDKARTLILRKKAALSWAGRRGWDVLTTGDMSRIPFRNRLSYCLDRASSDWQKISDYYAIRNDLAHVGATTAPFAVPLVATDLKNIGGRLRT